MSSSAAPAEKIENENMTAGIYGVGAKRQKTTDAELEKENPDDNHESPEAEAADEEEEPTIDSAEPDPEELETEEQVWQRDPEMMQEFEARMERHEIQRGSNVWHMLFGEVAVSRWRASTRNTARSSATPLQRPEAVEVKLPEVSDGFDDWADLEDGDEQARVGRMCRPVVPPSAEEVRRHNVAGHCQYRSWCPVCVAAAANDDAHQARPDPEGAFPEVHCDYMFCRNRRGDREFG